jgi:hypothetical protein
VSSLPGKARALQEALREALHGDVKRAAAICQVVKVSIDLHEAEGRDAELEALHEQVKQVLHGRRPIDGLVLAAGTEDPTGGTQ